MSENCLYLRKGNIFNVVSFLRWLSHFHGYLSYAIINKWFNLRAGLSFPVATDSSRLGPESQSPRQVQWTSCESSHPGEKEMSSNGSESTYTDRKKVRHFTIPYTHTNWTGVLEILTITSMNLNHTQRLTGFGGEWGNLARVFCL